MVRLSVHLIVSSIEVDHARYTEAIVLFKAHPDNAWHAAALEGLVTVSILESWMAGHSVSPFTFRCIINILNHLG